MSRILSDFSLSIHFSKCGLFALNYFNIMHLPQAKLVPSAENVVKYAHIPKPDGVGEGSMPYASWRCMSDSNGSSNGMY